MIPRLISALILGVLLLHPGHSLAQDTGFPVLRGPYLGQNPPGKTAEIFAPGIVSVERFGEFVCIFTPDGRECFFDRHGDDEYPHGAVLTTRIQNGIWIEPVIADLFSGFGEVFLPTLSPDGRYWFFTSTTLPVPDDIEGRIPMFFMEKAESGWTAPAYCADAIHASATREGTVYISSGRPIMAGHPVISPDGSYLIFDNSDLPRVGECRLFVIFNDDGVWSDPVSLGDHIAQHAFCAWISADGKYLFFHSRDNAKGNIYWISTDIIADVRTGRH